MGLFKSKQEKEIEKKMLVKKTINQMNKHIATLEGQKKVYLDAAKRAKNLTKFCGIDSNFTNTLANKIKNNIQTKIPEINPKLKALSKNKEFLLDFK